MSWWLGFCELGNTDRFTTVPHWQLSVRIFYIPFLFHFLKLFYRFVYFCYMMRLNWKNEWQKTEQSICPRGKSQNWIHTKLTMLTTDRVWIQLFCDWCWMFNVYDRTSHLRESSTGHGSLIFPAREYNKLLNANDFYRFRACRRVIFGKCLCSRWMKLTMQTWTSWVTKYLPIRVLKFAIITFACLHKNYANNTTTQRCFESFNFETETKQLWKLINLWNAEA